MEAMYLAYIPRDCFIVGNGKRICKGDPIHFYLSHELIILIGNWRRQHPAESWNLHKVEKDTQAKVTVGTQHALPKKNQDKLLHWTFHQLSCYLFKPFSQIEIQPSNSKFQKDTYPYCRISITVK